MDASAAKRRGPRKWNGPKLYGYIPSEETVMQYARDHNYQGWDGHQVLAPSFEGALMFLLKQCGFAMWEYDVDVVVEQGEDELVIIIASTNSRRGLPATPPSPSRIAKLQCALGVSEAPKWY